MFLARPLALFALFAAAWGVIRHYLAVPVQQVPQGAVQRIAFPEDSIRLIGPVAQVAELETGLTFQARVDTGARRCSLHVEEWRVDDEQPEMQANVDKTIHLRLVNRRGESEWLTRTIAEVAVIRTSEQEETRYLVPMQLAHKGVEREVLVSLNDRSQMNYAMLLGRNYLSGEFVVDVSRSEPNSDLLASNP